MPPRVRFPAGPSRVRPATNTAAGTPPRAPSTSTPPPTESPNEAIVRSPSPQVVQRRPAQKRARVERAPSASQALDARSEAVPPPARASSSRGGQDRPAKELGPGGRRFLSEFEANFTEILSHKSAAALENPSELHSADIMLRHAYTIVAFCQKVHQDLENVLDTRRDEQSSFEALRKEVEQIRGQDRRKQAELDRMGELFKKLEQEMLSYKNDVSALKGKIVEKEANWETIERQLATENAYLKDEVVNLKKAQEEASRGEEARVDEAVDDAQYNLIYALWKDHPEFDFSSMGEEVLAYIEEFKAALAREQGASTSHPPSSRPSTPTEVEPEVPPPPGSLPDVAAEVPAEDPPVEVAAHPASPTPPAN